MPLEKKPKPKMTLREIISELVERTNSNIRRLRELEQREKALNSRMNTLEQETIVERKKLDTTLSDINSRITTVDEKVAKIQNTIKEIIDQLKRVATSGKIKELESLVDIYNPLKSQFVTREEVERLLEESKEK